MLTHGSSEVFGSIKIDHLQINSFSSTPKASMASKTPLRRICLACRHQLRIQHEATQPTLLPIRSLSNTPSRSSEIDTDLGETVRPRWQQTPKDMTMPFRVRPKMKNVEWSCNNDPRKLDAMYIRLLGEGGNKMLSEEVKWLAITHKSFDQGKRGFNARLSYFGASSYLQSIPS